MEKQIIEEEQRVVLKLEGMLDTPTGQKLIAQVEGMKCFEEKNIVVDCTNLTYISSFGLRLLLMLRKISWANHHNMSVIGVSPSVSTVLKLAGMQNLFTL